MRAVPPPTRAMGRCPARCRCAMDMSCSRLPDVQAVAGGVEADVEGDLLGVQQLAQARLVGALADEAALLQRVESTPMAHSPTLW